MEVGFMIVIGAHVLYNWSTGWGKFMDTA